MNLEEEELAYNSAITATSLISISSSEDRSKSLLLFEKVVKRTMDIIGSMLGMVMLVPLTICMYMANWISGDKGPVFYTQERYGKNGKIFKMYKYRSMVIDADEKLETYLEENQEAKEEFRKYKKLKHDPRITKIGNFIRKTSIDEFPQFINVLKGEMSLVGPRPYLPREKEDINGFFNYIMSMKPGITGFWQTNGRSNTTFMDRLEMDMQYYHLHNLKLDIYILQQTVTKLVKKEGAI